MKKQMTSRLGLIVLSITTYVFLCFISISNITAQPPTMNKYVDDLELCKIPTGNTDKMPVGLRQFCTLAKDKDVNADINTRNDLIEIVIGQIDDHYRDYKNGIRKKNNFFQTILDILEVGASTTIDFIKGERAKTVIASALTGLKGGRSAFNKNFELRQLDVLINRMNTDRANVLVRIIGNKSEPAGKYRWLHAKRDLRDYYEAGTWGHALDSLISTTGGETQVAEKKVADLNDLKKAAGIQLAPSAEQYKAVMTLDNSIYQIESAWEAADTKRSTAIPSIAAAQAKIDEANAAPVDIPKRDAWMITKAAAIKERDDAQVILDASRERLKKVYVAAVADSEVKALLDKIPVKYAARLANITPRKARIDGDAANGTNNATFEDYLFMLQLLSGVTLDELGKNTNVVERIKNMIEASK